MDPAQQQAWLGRLEQRAGRAARLTLSPDDAAKQQARVAGLLHRKLVTWECWHDLIAETNRQERAAIDLLADAIAAECSTRFHKQSD